MNYSFVIKRLIKPSKMHEVNVGIIGLLRWIYRPYSILAVTVILSFIAWQFPLVRTRLGYLQKEEMTLYGMAILLLWYLVIFIFSYWGYRIGNKTKPIKGLNSSLMVKRSYFILTCFALIGMTYTFIFSIGINNAFEWVFTTQANNLLYTMRANYLLGLNSIRWVCIITGGMAWFYLFVKKEINILNILNIVLLVANSLISSRLSLVMSLFIFVGLIIKEKKVPSLLSWILIGTLAVGGIVGLTYTRNNNYYSTFYNVNKPIEMALAESIAYLGAPFQVAIGVSNNPGLIKWDKTGGFIQNWMIPTYFRNQTEMTYTTYEYTYRDFIDIQEGLTTNSAFAELATSGGILAFFWIAFVCFAGAWAVGHLWNYSNLMCMGSMSIIYAFAELWRVFIFNSGMLHINLILIAFATILASIRFKVN